MTTTQSPPETPHDPQGPQNQGGFNLALWVILSVIIAIPGGLWIWTTQQSPIRINLLKHEPLPVIGKAPPFELTESSGRTLRLEDLAGRIWIADFIFTRCGGTCPTMTRGMAALQRSLSRIPEVWPPAHLVSFTVDPEWDTPDRLAEYAERHDASPDHWYFVTGEYEELQDIARNGFKLAVEQANGAEGFEDEPIIHSQSFVLMDKLGQIRGYYDGTDMTAIQRLIRDVTRLAKEK